MLIDVAIVIVLVASVLAGLAQGFFRSIFSLVGLFLGLTLAAWNYRVLAVTILPMVKLHPLADAIAFLLIAVVVMLLAAAIGKILAKLLHYMGLGCFDRVAGAIFGFFQGALLVTIVILVTVAFFPKARWLAEAQLPKYFFGACHLSAQVTPGDLALRVRQGLKELEEESPQWMHPSQEKM
jgi:membrane protein required for colicin V production